jgi:hypothetical protein
VKHSSMEIGSFSQVPGTVDAQSLLVDSAISHCEKLRRVLELEAWIQEAQHHPILAQAAERWQEERSQLLAQLQLLP